MDRQPKIGRLSDLMKLRRRADWSKLTARLKALEPGQQFSERCPEQLSMSAFRSTILTIGNRVHTEDWRVSTRTEGRKVHCFLAPACKEN